MLKTRTKAFALLALVAAFAIAAHLFKPTTWPPLGGNTLHSLHGPGFALISEIAQIPGTRNAEAKDLFVDALGIFGALGIAASFDKKVRQVLPKWAKTSADGRMLLQQISVFFTIRSADNGKFHANQCLRPEILRSPLPSRTNCETHHGIFGQRVESPYSPSNTHSVKP